MIYLITLGIALAAVWIGLSGVFTPLLLTLAAISIAIVLFLGFRLRLLDPVTVPYLRLPQFLSYWVWLVGEIFKANWTVIKACLKADMDIDPALVRIKTICKSDMAKTVFANSITLTPGTVTVDIDGDRLLVHALYEQQALPEAFTEMDERSARASDGAEALKGGAA